MLALICGTGGLPRTLARAADTPPLVCALHGFAPDNLAVDLRFRLEHLGSLLQTLTAKRVTQICLCGAIRRPQIDPSQIDGPTEALMPIIAQALRSGDDGALRAVIQVFEQAAFDVIGAHEIAPALLPAPGILTEARPDPKAVALIPQAQTALRDMAAKDLGQSCVVAAQGIITQEDDRGTDAMLADLPKTAGGVLFKAPKPGQELRADMPTIGPETARNAVRANLEGIMIAERSVLVLERDTVLDILNAAGLFLEVRPL